MVMRGVYTQLDKRLETRLVLALQLRRRILGDRRLETRNPGPQMLNSVWA